MYNLSYLSHEFPALALSSIDSEVRALKTARDRYSDQQSDYNKDQLKAALAAIKSTVADVEAAFSMSQKPLRERMGR